MEILLFRTPVDQCFFLAEWFLSDNRINIVHRNCSKCVWIKKKQGKKTPHQTNVPCKHLVQQQFEQSILNPFAARFSQTIL